jgi:microcystin-dependent protein
MAVSQTTRFSIYRWSSDADGLTRAQFDSSHEQIELQVAKFIEGTALPSASSANARAFFLNTSTGVLYYSSTGSTWVTINSYAAPLSTLTPGASNTEGSAITSARSDHSHAMLAFATSATSVSTATAAGSAATYSRGDHTHNLAANSVTAGTIATGAIDSTAAFASGVYGTPSGTQTPGDANSAGSAATVARSDHNHAMLPFSATTTTVSTSGTAGAANTYARGDHAHALGTGSVTAGTIGTGAIDSTTAFASGIYGTPSGTLTPGGSNTAGSAGTVARSDHSHAMLAFSVSATSVSSASPSAGSATTYSRGDHTHNLAANSVTAGTIATGGISASGSFAAGVVDNSALGANAVSRDKIVEAERIPVGAIMPYAGTTAPTGWLFCNGSNISRSTYATLFSAIGTTYGAGDGSTTFSLPNLISRYLSGASTMGSSPSTGVGTTSGATTVTLETANLPSHSHDAGTLSAGTHAAHNHASGTIATGLSDLSHTHDIGHDHADSTTGNDGVHSHTIRSTQSTAIAGSGNSVAMSGGGFSSAYIANSSSHTHTVNVTAHAGSSGAASASMSHAHTISGSTADNSAQGHTVTGNTGLVGSGTAISIIPPTIIMNFIIKT